MIHCKKKYVYVLCNTCMRSLSFLVVCIKIIITVLIWSRQINLIYWSTIQIQLIIRIEIQTSRPHRYWLFLYNASHKSYPRAIYELLSSCPIFFYSATCTKRPENGYNREFYKSHPPVNLQQNAHKLKFVPALNGKFNRFFISFIVFYRFKTVKRF